MVSANSTYLSLYQQGMAFYTAGHYEQALDAIKRSIVMQPDYTDAYDQIAKIYSELREYEEAVSIYEKLVVLLPNDLEIRCALGMTLIKAGEEKRGVKVLKRVLKMNACYSAARLELIRYYMKQKRYCAANTFIVKGIRLLPDYAPFYCMAGELARRKNKLEKAQDYYEQCLDLDPNYDPAKRGMNAVIRAMENPGGVRNEKSEEDEAREDLVAAASFYRSGEFDQAILRLMDIKENPSVARDASVLLGLSFVKKGLFKRARDVLHGFVQEHQPDVSVLYNLGLTANRMGRYDEAVDYLAQALEIDEDYVEALIEMGIACLMTQEYSAAKDLFVRAIKLDNDNPRSYAYLARIAFDKGDRAKTAEFLKKAKKMDNNNVDINLNLGYIAVKNGKFDDALGNLKKCLETLPDHFEAHKLMGQAKLEKGDREGAELSYQAAITLNPSDPHCMKMIQKINSLITA
jgi:tetratricopeptide (TPR) repeat protein